MAQFDFANRINAQVAWPVRLVTGNTNVTAIDTQGFEGVAVAYSIGQTINGNPQMNIAFLVGADTNVANATAINANYITKAPVAINTVNTVGWAGVGPLGGGENTRYVFPNIVANAANFNGTVIAILGRPHQTPTT
jgi:hypothetical protein